jgi:hypothetical protein
MKKVLFLCYYSGFNHTEHILYKKIFSDNQKYTVHTIKFHSEIRKEKFDQYDFIFCGCFTLNKNIIDKYSNKMYLDILEPIEFRKDDNVFSIYKKDTFLGYMGCIPYGTKSVKYPLYYEYMGDNRTQKILEIQNYVKDINFEDFSTKQFCYLINRHDAGNTRTTIFKKLSKIDIITCPSNLFNNYSNEEFEKEGTNKFRKRFIFSICPENFITTLDGYVTEKIYIALSNGNIPIYYGKLDEIDKKIFNMNRILWYNPIEQESIQEIYEKVLELMKDKQKLFEFYKQPPFLETAIETLDIMETNYINTVKKWLNIE